MIKYKKVLLKLSGESLMGSGSHGIEPESLFAMQMRSGQFPTWGLNWV
jgi:uridylate kinase